ncbi:MAG TPA: NADH-quinone oxidoreductase subunit L [Spirochaetia bacterium]|nr:NADH-quinone oxidoreductase subunit L [Spirochaetia bacterium]
MPDPVTAAILAPLLPLAAFVLALAVTKRRAGVAAGISITAVAVALLLSLWLLRGQLLSAGPIERELPWLHAGSLQISVGVLIDPLASLMMVIVTAVSLLVQIYSLGYMKGDPAFARFFSYLSLFTFSMLTLVIANNFILLYMAWELVGLCSYLLIGFWYQRPAAASAAKKAFIVTRFGDFGFLAGILVLSVLAGGFGLGDAQRLVSSGGLAAGQVTLIALLLFCGAIGKSGQFPLHVWLPDAMEGPTPVSALIHSATMVAAGVFMVARLYGVFQGSADAMRVVASLGAFTALFAAAIALAQDDIKRVLAYSTISQLGYMMLALGVGGYGAGIFHLTTHAAFKTLLFLCAGSVIHALGTNDIWKMGGLARRMPITAVTFLVAVLAISGIFPLSGFWSKDEILQAALSSGHIELYVVALVTVFLTAFYMARVFFVVFSGPSAPHAHESPAVMTIPMIVLGLLAIGLGAIGLPWLSRDIHTFLAPTAPRPSGLDLAVLLESTTLATAGIILALLFYGLRLVKPESLRRAAGPAYTVLARKFYIDELYLLVIRGLFFAVTEAIAWFDRHVVDGAVNLVGAASLRGGGALRKSVSGKVQGYALIVVCGVTVTLVVLLLVNRSLIFGGR